MKILRTLAVLMICIVIIDGLNHPRIKFKEVNLKLNKNYDHTIQDSEMETTDILEETVDLPEVLPDDLEAEYWYDSLEYLACCVEAEAGNQTELGKRLVCDTVLNRFDSGKYESLYDVINEPGQYSVVENGKILTVTPSEETYRIVNEELECRTNTEVLYFRTDHYHKFGTPLFREGDHYFSK